ncbi:MAG: hypothetical protein AAF518_18855 [Spirochaetota bacterium]
MKRFFLLLLVLGCRGENGESKKITEQANKQRTVPPLLQKFSREAIVKNLRRKVRLGQALSVHLFVPLCDNENQGIVPVNQALGNGKNLKTNLYWGSRYGIKSYFKIDKHWKLLYEKKNVSESILERIVFFRQYHTKTKVYLIADAYQGDRMQDCLKDFINAVAGKVSGELLVDGVKVGTNHSADLIGFNGHNGLMDVSIPTQLHTSSLQKDAVVIACISNRYFSKRLLQAQAYPLILTTGLLAPEAYVISNIIDSWANLQSAKRIRLSAAKGYHKYQKCGLRGAKRLFQTGW